MSFFLLPRLKFIHTRPTKVANSTRQGHKIQSHGSLFSPIVEMVRKPTVALDNLLEEFQGVSSLETLQRREQQEFDGRRAVLQLKLRNASTPSSC